MLLICFVSYITFVYYETKFKSIRIWKVCIARTHQHEMTIFCDSCLATVDNILWMHACCNKNKIIWHNINTLMSLQDTLIYFLACQSNTWKRLSIKIKIGYISHRSIIWNVLCFRATLRLSFHPFHEASSFWWKLNIHYGKSGNKKVGGK